MTSLLSLKNIALLALLHIFVVIHIHLWPWKKDALIFRIEEQRHKITQAQNDIAHKIQLNDHLRTELQDLEDGLYLIEEQARRELLMVKPGEILIQIVPVAPP